MEVCGSGDYRAFDYGTGISDWRNMGGKERFISIEVAVCGESNHGKNTYWSYV